MGAVRRELTQCGEDRKVLLQEAISKWSPKSRRVSGRRIRKRRERSKGIASRSSSRHEKAQQHRSPLYVKSYK